MASLRASELHYRLSDGRGLIERGGRYLILFYTGEMRNEGEGVTAYLIASSLIGDQPIADARTSL